jgi:Ion channel
MVRRRKIPDNSLPVAVAVLEAFMWWVFIAMRTRVPANPILVICFSAGAVAMVVIVVIFRDRPLHVVAVIVLFTFITLINLFSVLYWQYGSRANFNIPLSHLDAVYFTLGTLSTAGTGNIVATSETSRAIQSLQMGVGFGVILLAAGILVSRLASARG